MTQQWRAGGWQLVVAAWATGACATMAQGATIPVPSDLAPRSTYHLVFNTNPIAVTGQSTSIAYYNSAAQYAANQVGLGTEVGLTWYAIVSTPSVDARANAVIGSNSPVYNLRASGIERVATGYGDFWDGTLTASLAYAGNGQFTSLDAWTGSTSSGLRDTGHELGRAMPTRGRPLYVDGRWADYDQYQVQFPQGLYALSAPLVVPLPAWTLSGDYNADGVVDAGDYLLWRNTLGSTTDWRADGDGDGVIGTGDYLHWKERFGDSPGALMPSVGTAIPEPATVLVLWGMLLLAWVKYV
jgi:hypothetical protein